MMDTRDLLAALVVAWLFILMFLALDAARPDRICDGTEHPAQHCVSAP